MEAEVQKDRILTLLQDIVGPEHASADPALLIPYSRDQHWPIAGSHMPDYVVRPKTVEEVQKILRLANRYRIPVIPVSSNTNIRGLTIPHHGGIILDLKRMDYLEIDVKNRAAVIGPGVSCARLADEAEKYGLRPVIPGAPSTVNMLSNCLLRGVSNIGPRYGHTGDQVLGMEVVLPTGEVLYTGAAAFPNVGPYFRYFGPDWAGLFQGQPGIMGVVTKMAVRLYPLPERQEMFMCGFTQREGEPEEGPLRRAMAFMHDLMLHDPPVITFGVILHWVAAAITMVEKREDIDSFKGTLGDWVVLGSIEGSRDFVKYGRSVVEKEIKKHWDNIDEGREVVLMSKMLRDELKAARRIFRWFRLGNYYALAWWGPLDRFDRYYFEALKVWKELGITEELSIVGIPAYPYVGQLTYYELDSFWDSTDERNTERIKKFTEIMYQKMIDLGIYCWFRPYPGVYESTIPRLKGCMGELWYRVKRLLDPNNIMNPGKVFPE